MYWRVLPEWRTLTIFMVFSEGRRPRDILMLLVAGRDMFRAWGSAAAKEGMQYKGLVRRRVACLCGKTSHNAWLYSELSKAVQRPSGRRKHRIFPEMAELPNLSS